MSILGVLRLLQESGVSCSRTIIKVASQSSIPSCCKEEVVMFRVVLLIGILGWTVRSHSHTCSNTELRNMKYNKNLKEDAEDAVDDAVEDTKESCRLDKKDLIVCRAQNGHGSSVTTACNYILGSMKATGKLKKFTKYGCDKKSSSDHIYVACKFSD